MQFRPTYNALQSYKDRNFELSQYKRMNIKECKYKYD